MSRHRSSNQNVADRDYNDYLNSDENHRRKSRPNPNPHHSNNNTYDNRFSDRPRANNPPKRQPPPRRESLDERPSSTGDTRDSPRDRMHLSRDRIPSDEPMPKEVPSSGERVPPVGRYSDNDNRRQDNRRLYNQEPPRREPYREPYTQAEPRGRPLTRPDNRAPRGGPDLRRGVEPRRGEMSRNRYSQNEENGVEDPGPGRRPGTHPDNRVHELSEADKKAQAKWAALCERIKEWNSNRLEIFHCSFPDKVSSSSLNRTSCAEQVVQSFVQSFVLFPCSLQSDA